MEALDGIAPSAEPSLSLRQRRGAGATAVPLEEGAIEKDITPNATVMNGQEGEAPKQDSSSPSSMSESAKMDESQEDSNEDDVNEEKLPLSTFSLMFLAEAHSGAHTYAWTVFAVQLGIVLAAIADNFDASQPQNPAKFPAGVPVSVTIAQAIMIPISVAAQNDFVTAVVRLNDRRTVTVVKKKNDEEEGGQQDTKFRDRLLHHSSSLILPWLDPGTTYSKWLLSSLAQLCIGFGILVVSFVFMMQSETVFQVLVNFIALIMISNISVISFNMAANGFLGFEVWKSTKQVAQHVVKRKYKSDVFKQICYVLAVLAMYSGYASVVYRQQTGYFQCQKVMVQFDDEFDPYLPFLSGVYDMTTNRTQNRFIFADEVTQDSFSMAYCGDQGAWTISETSDDDPCKFLTASQPSLAFDVSLTGATPWRGISQRDESLVDTSSFLMQCADCDVSSCKPDRGTCVDGNCVCNDGRYGLHCEFRAPCEEIVLDAKRGPFPAITSIVTRDVVVPDSQYRVLRGDNETLVLAHHRPVYVSRGFQYVILFTGRRWAIVSPRIAMQAQNTMLFGQLSEEEVRRLLVAFLRNQHLYSILTLPSVQQFAVSEAVDLGSPLDTGVPIGLNWLGVRAIRISARVTFVIDRLLTYNSRFVCRFCDPEGDECDNLSRCNPESRTCECRTDTVLGFPIHTGALCEKTLTCFEAQEQNGGTPSDACFGDDYFCMETGECSCVQQFPDGGRFCQFLPCYSEAIQAIGGCQNNGTCSEETGQCICNADLFKGRFCDEDVPACFDSDAVALYPPNGCSQGGLCNNTTGFCECPPGRTGRYCQRVVARCDDALTMDLYPPNGCATANTTCNSETGQCDCPSGIFQGVSCEITNLACDHPDVQNIFPNCTGHGFCNTTTGDCQCNSTAFDGRYCQLDVGVVVFNETN